MIKSAILDESEKRFTLRMDGELFKAFSLIAKKHKRSVAKEIEMAIEYYLNYIAEDTQKKE